MFHRHIDQKIKFIWRWWWMIKWWSMIEYCRWWPQSQIIPHYDLWSNATHAPTESRFIVSTHNERKNYDRILTQSTARMISMVNWYKIVWLLKTWTITCFIIDILFCRSRTTRNRKVSRCKEKTIFIVTCSLFSSTTQ